MSDFNGHGPNDPLDPLDYAPRWLRERPGRRSTLVDEPLAEQDARPQPARQAAARLRSLDPEVVPEPPGLGRGRQSWSMAGFAGRIMLSVVVAAVAALFFVIMMARQPSARSSLASTLATTTAALSGNAEAEEASKPALAEFREMLATAGEANQATPRQSDQLLQQFLVWRKKAYPNAPLR
jgi:hypothetical protein